MQYWKAQLQQEIDKSELARPRHAEPAGRSESSGEQAATRAMARK